MISFLFLSFVNSRLVTEEPDITGNSVSVNFNATEKLNSIGIDHPYVCANFDWWPDNKCGFQCHTKYRFLIGRELELQSISLKTNQVWLWKLQLDRKWAHKNWFWKQDHSSGTSLIASLWHYSRIKIFRQQQHFLRTSMDFWESVDLCKIMWNMILNRKKKFVAISWNWEMPGILSRFRFGGKDASQNWSASSCLNLERIRIWRLFLDWMLKLGKLNMVWI